MAIVALLGRPNVGKSTLFNRLTRTRNALVIDIPGVTRDRQYGYAHLNQYSYTVVDTGGLVDTNNAIASQITEQSIRAAQQADLVLLLVDAQQGINAADSQIAQQLRQLNTPVQLVINKADTGDVTTLLDECYRLGVGDPIAISATWGRGIGKLNSSIQDRLPNSRDLLRTQAMVIGVVGRPNVGKSTYINRLLGEERLLVLDEPGTTRDSIFVPFEYQDQPMTLVDTAGVRQRSRISNIIEKYSVIKTLQTIDQADIIIMMLDARSGIGAQDANLLGYLLEQGKALVLAVNKWDRLSFEQRTQVKGQLARKLRFVSFIKLHFISARHGSGVLDVLDSAQQVYQMSRRCFSTPLLNRLLKSVVAEHRPPTIRGYGLKLRYIHQGGVNPPRFIVHGNADQGIPKHYYRYLLGRIRNGLQLQGSVIELEFRKTNNPFKDRRSQVKHRQTKKAWKARNR